MNSLHSLVSFSACILALATATSASLTGCNVAADKIPLPSHQTNLTVPSNVTLEYITYALGTQNYSCGITGKYQSMGAVATLFDASCIFRDTDIISTENKAHMPSTLGCPQVLGRHYFVNNTTHGGSTPHPTFDFRADSQRDNPSAFVIATKIGDIPSPSDPSMNIDWLELKGIRGDGTLAKTVFRIMTSGGQPPSSCTPGSNTTVPYAATYWFYN